MTLTKSSDIIQKLLDNDPFSQWLGIELLSVSRGKVALAMNVRDEMLNGFSVAHGAIPYALADTTLAFAANSRNKISMTLTNNISYLRKIQSGDRLIARSEEVSLNRHYGVYLINVERSDQIKLAAFRGTVYRSKHNVDERLP